MKSNTFPHFYFFFLSSLFLFVPAIDCSENQQQIDSRTSCWCEIVFPHSFLVSFLPPKKHRYSFHQKRKTLLSLNLGPVLTLNEVEGVEKREKTSLFCVFLFLLSNSTVFHSCAPYRRKKETEAGHHYFPPPPPKKVTFSLKFFFFLWRNSKVGEGKERPSFTPFFLPPPAM